MYYYIVYNVRLNTSVADLWWEGGILKCFKFQNFATRITLYTMYAKNRPPPPEVSVLANIHLGIYKQ